MLKSTKILKEIEDVKKLLDPSIIEKARKYDELCARLKEIKFGVHKVSKSIDEKGRQQVVILYEQPREVVYVYDDGTTESSARFKSMNMLNMVTLRDMRMISEAIDSLKSK